MRLSSVHLAIWQTASYLDDSAFRSVSYAQSGLIARFSAPFGLLADPNANKRDDEKTIVFCVRHWCTEIFGLIQAPIQTPRFRLRNRARNLLSKQLSEQEEKRFLKRASWAYEKKRDIEMLRRDAQVSCSSPLRQARPKDQHERSSDRAASFSL